MVNPFVVEQPLDAKDQCPRRPGGRDGGRWALDRFKHGEFVFPVAQDDTVSISPGG